MNLFRFQVALSINFDCTMNLFRFRVALSINFDCMKITFKSLKSNTKLILSELRCVQSNFNSFEITLKYLMIVSCLYELTLSSITIGISMATNYGFQCSCKTLPFINHMLDLPKSLLDSFVSFLYKMDLVCFDI